MKTELGNLTIEPYQRKIAVFDAIAVLLEQCDIEELRGDLLNDLLEILGEYFYVHEKTEE